MILNQQWAAATLIAISVVTPALQGQQSNLTTEFFRVRQATESVILGLDTAGWLSWSNALPAGDYLIERSTGDAVSPWNPFVRGSRTNTLPHVKVSDPSPPPGMVFLPGGRFRMGDTFGEQSAATPVRNVTLNPFFMKRYEVTNDEVRHVFQWALDHAHIVVTSRGVESTTVGSTNVLLPLGRFAQEITFSAGQFGVRPGRGRYPVAYITWFGAVAFCNYLSLMESRPVCYDLTQWSCNFTLPGYRLPTEAEWEYAARAAHEGRRFAWSDTDEITHSRANYQSRTNNAFDVSPTRGIHPDYQAVRPNSSPVGDFAPNSFGLYDMCGNVWEWVWDWWGGRYPRVDEVNPTGVPSGTLRIFRGGSWLTTAERLTCAVRYPDQPVDSTEDVGFRFLLPAVQQAGRDRP